MQDVKQKPVKSQYEIHTLIRFRCLLKIRFFYIRKFCGERQDENQNNNSDHSWE